MPTRSPQDAPIVYLHAVRLFASKFMQWHAVQIIKVVRHVLLEKGWWQLPRYAFGTSSGGCIALELALRFPLQVQFTIMELLSMYML